jgi:hypothetical protein
MARPFDEFVADFQAALRDGDQEFVRAVYQHWVDTSGMLPDEYRETFPELVLGEVGPLGSQPVKGTETFDEYGTVRFADPADPDAETSVTFRLVDDAWTMFNERSGFTAFRKVYTLWYSVTGGKAAIRFNGKRHPLVAEPTDDSASGVVSPINCGLKPGANEVSLVKLDGEPEVTLRISSAVEGEIADSSGGDVVMWEGTVGEDVTLPFEAV